MNYYKSIVDRNGYVHSCDNVIVEYLVKNFNTDSIVEEFHKIKELINPEVYWEKLHVSSCSKFSFYENVVHINSIHILFGKYREYDRLLRKWIILPMIRIEVNPNKHYDTPEFKAIFEFIKEWCCSMDIRKIDYAIDLPYTIDKVCIYNSRKEPGLYKGTVYRGARGKNGFCRIYNKAKEQRLDYPLTRVEHTMEVDKPRSL